MDRTVDPSTAGPPTRETAVKTGGIPVG